MSFTTDNTSRLAQLINSASRRRPEKVLFAAAPQLAKCLLTAQRSKSPT